MNLKIAERNYYYLISGLPNLVIDSDKPHQKVLSLAFRNEFRDQAHPLDFELAKLLYLPYDNKNLLNILFKEENDFSELGNYSSEELSEEINDPTNLEEYMVQLINSFKEGTFTISDRNKIYSLFYIWVLKTKNEFLQRWFEFDKNMNNLLTALNGDTHQFNFEKQLIPVPNHNEVYDALIQKGPKLEAIADELPYAEEIINTYNSELSITEKEKAFDLIKWKFVDEHTVFNYFTIEKVLAHIIKLQIVDRWIKMDAESGKALFNKMVHDLKSSYVFSDEFSLTKTR